MHPSIAFADLRVDAIELLHRGVGAVDAEEVNSWLVCTFFISPLRTHQYSSPY